MSLFPDTLFVKLPLLFGKCGLGLLRRAMAALLVILVILQCGPFAICFAEASPPGEREEQIAHFEPLPVCDGADGFTTFLADYPWLPGKEYRFSPHTPQTRLSIRAGAGPADGYTRNVYRPPRRPAVSQAIMIYPGSTAAGVYFAACG